MSVTTGPALGEPLPIELANTTYAVRGHTLDGLQNSEQLELWLDQVRSRLPVPITTNEIVEDSDLAMARRIRDSVRALAKAAVQGTRPPAATIEVLNQAVRSAPRWRELRWDDSPESEAHSTVRPVAAALSAIAEAAVDLFAGPMLADVRACHGPGCVLFFVKNHPRREWCSPACGNRARVHKHHDRARRA
jgi:predicted RNA-binding Zn ribbon-like protein